MKKLSDMKENKNLENKLMINFNKALKEESFKEFIDKLGLSYEELSKYTSILEESNCEYQNCQKCKSILECKNKITGYVYLPKIKNNNLDFRYQKCRYLKKLDDQNKYLDNIYMYNIPDEIKNANLKDIYMNDEERHETIKYIGTFMKDYQKNKNVKGLYLYGNFGCGKTYLISAMLHELAKKNYKSAIVFWPEFLRNLKTLFSNNDEFKIEFNKVKEAPILFIDDIGAENITAWARDEILCTILQYRMDEKLPTFFSSNLTLEELEEHLRSCDNSSVKAGRIIERIRQLTNVQKMVSKNLRK